MFTSDSAGLPTAPPTRPATADFSDTTMTDPAGPDLKASSLAILAWRALALTAVIASHTAAHAQCAYPSPDTGGGLPPASYFQ